MGNHYHHLLEIPEPNLVEGMRWFQSTYTQRFNARHKVCGTLFQGRYEALPIDQGEYIKTVADYIHQNPARAHDEMEAERLLQQGLKICGLTERELPELKKGDDRKKVIAWHIRKRTSIRTEWVTTRLNMGATSNFSCYVRDVEQSTKGLLWELKNKITN